MEQTELSELHKGAGRSRGRVDVEGAAGGSRFRTGLKIFVGVPWLRNGDIYEGYFQSCKRHIKAQRLQAISQMTIFRTSPHHLPFSTGRAKVQAITTKLNELVDAFLESDADLIWIVDADVEPPENALMMLLELDADVATGVYPLHGKSDVMAGGRLGPSPKHRLMPCTFDYLQGKILGEKDRVAAGNGCLLVKRRVFEIGMLDGKPFRFRYKPGLSSSDLQFFFDVQELGFITRLHGDVVCGHLPNWPLKDLMMQRVLVNISVVIPFYDKKGPFGAVWKSLKPQLRLGDEVIIVDDYSPGTFDFREKWTRVIRPMQKAEPHIYRLCLLRNLGISEAKNDAILLLDPDCVPESFLLEQARGLFRQGVVYGARIDYINKDASISEDPRLSWKMIKGKSKFVDFRPDGIMSIWGGCMLFSKVRTSLVGWFDRRYEGRWGAEEQDFLSKCYHSGMRLRYEQRLYVRHQFHETWRQGYKENLKILRERQTIYFKHLDKVTGYKPEETIEYKFSNPDKMMDYLTRLFREVRPVKVKLIHIGASSADVNAALTYWIPRFVIDFERKP